MMAGPGGKGKEREMPIKPERQAAFTPSILFSSLLAMAVRWSGWLAGTGS